ncbi:molybdate transport system substrate-binding protein [Palleronia marisminoris]|uniref:Molybdate-binding periplasmic protein n=1 Tax=Palleronia marisminoris TaxID=315423 RepID=A0A1Y5T515_9RHOB|nr:molybdate ABC transporter substrate-binding protein [Palleronia marisminoris]SFH17245.1 molybdate transport system substrate-binding protein [Palleronia marisminoris]SLN55943.1 Molybdate-binding periplasmic protein precursor [Palleronia marisminoris]
MLRPIALCLALVPFQAVAAEVTVFAAASLKTALDKVVPGYEAASGNEVSVVLAGSSALARQIIQGAPGDVFVSANPGWMDEVEAAGRLAPGSRRDLLGNRLVLVAGVEGPAVEIATAEDMPAPAAEGRIGMALVDAVPAGIYGRAALESLGLWQDYAPRVAQADNVRAALALVAMGAVPSGIVYATDAAAEPRVYVRGRFAPDLHPAIRYPAAVLEGSETGAGFLDWLEGTETSAIFDEAGFEVID